jgi:DNA-binding GntR family transcriptional regulator
MPLTSIHLPGRQSRARELHAALREAILDGTLHAGDRLVEEQIAELASVSRTPVREAIRRLEAEGLIEDSGSGAVAVTLGADALAEICEVREALEGLACRLAARGGTEMTILTLEDLIARWAACVESNASVEEFVRLNNAFHETIWQASGNSYLTEQLKVLRARIELSGHTTLRDPERLAEATAEHAELFGAIRDHNPEQAAELAGRHFRKAMALRLAASRFDATEPMPTA